MANTEWLFGLWRDRGVRIRPPVEGEYDDSRKLAKATGLYQKMLEKDPSGRFHPRYSLHANTGRVISRDPNIHIWRSSKLAPDPGKRLMMLGPRFSEATIILLRMGYHEDARSLQRHEGTSLVSWLELTFGYPPGTLAMVDKQTFYLCLYGALSHVSDAGRLRPEHIHARYPALREFPSLDGLKAFNQRCQRELAEISLDAAERIEQEMPGSTICDFHNEALLEVSPENYDGALVRAAELWNAETHPLLGIPWNVTDGVATRVIEKPTQLSRLQLLLEAPAQ